MVALSPVSEIFSDRMWETGESGTAPEEEGDEIFEDLIDKTAICFSPAMRAWTRGRRLKAGPFRRIPVEIRIPLLASHPGDYLFKPDQLAALLTASDRIPGGRLRRILLLPEFYRTGNRVLSSAFLFPSTLVFYLSPLRLLLAGPDVRPVWRAGGDYLFEALFQFLDRPDLSPSCDAGPGKGAGEDPGGSLFFLSVTEMHEKEIEAMEVIHDRFVLRHPMHTGLTRSASVQGT